MKLFKKGEIFVITLGISLLFFSIGAIFGNAIAKREKQTVEVDGTEAVTYSETTIATKPFKVEVATHTHEPEFDEHDKEMIALVTAAEAEGECEEGKRLVIDTVLNRYDSDEFPNTIAEVVYQENQFTGMWDGRAEVCIITDDIRELVDEEIRRRYNSEVLYFRAGEYSENGTPLFQVGNHYFSR